MVVLAHRQVNSAAAETGPLLRTFSLRLSKRCAYTFSAKRAGKLHLAVRVRACAQELGQPVQCMRTGLGKSSCSSSFRTIAIARFFVSMIATPQNCRTRDHTPHQQHT